MTKVTFFKTDECYASIWDCECGYRFMPLGEDTKFCGGCGKVIEEWIWIGGEIE